MARRVTVTPAYTPTQRETWLLLIIALVFILAGLISGTASHGDGWMQLGTWHIFTSDTDAGIFVAGWGSFFWKGDVGPFICNGSPLEPYLPRWVIYCG